MLRCLAEKVMVCWEIRKSEVNMLLLKCVWQWRSDATLTLTDSDSS